MSLCEIYTLFTLSFCKLSPHLEYAKVRGKDSRLEVNNMLRLNANGSGQVCKSFGLHAKLPAMKALYDDGMGLFLANTGRKF